MIIPSYLKFTLVLLSICLVVLVLYLAQNIFIPLLLSLLFAILLRPLVFFFHIKLRMNNALSCLISVFLFVLFFSGIIFLVSWKISEITNDWSAIKHNLNSHYANIQLWILQHYKVNYSAQETYFFQFTGKAFGGNNQWMGNTISSFTNGLFMMVLIPVYTFLILLYRSLFIEFLHKIVNAQQQDNLVDILSKIKTVIQSYILGLLIELSIVATLTTVGLMLIGVEYALLLGLITALFNLIPYIGIISAAVISILATLGNSTDLSLVFGVVLVNVIVQLIDNNILVPKIVGNQVRINALASIVGVIVGGSIAGLPGMFLSIPLIAILKVVFDHVNVLKPWAHLIGNSMSDIH